MEKVPANPKLTATESEQPGVSYWKITLDNIRGTHVQGQIARPSAGTKFPAILQMQYAGVYGLPINFARQIRCPVLIAMGLHDEKLAPPSSILAAVNVITALKEVIIMPQSGHAPVGDSQASYYSRMYGAWLPALKQQGRAPIEPPAKIGDAQDGRK